MAAPAASALALPGVRATRGSRLFQASGRAHMVSTRLTLAVCISLAAGIGAVASASADDMAAHRGGVLRMVAEAAGGTIDPHINYTQQFFQTEAYLYDG